jgi:class 3 adenylate cyclase
MPVNIASRLQQLAQPGDVLISRATVEAIEGHQKRGGNGAGLFEIIPLPQTHIKGIQKTVPVYRISKKAE